MPHFLTLTRSTLVHEIVLYPDIVSDSYKRIEKAQAYIRLRPYHAESCIIQSPPDLEIVIVKIGQGNNNVICCVYIPPECSFSYVSHVVQFLTDLTSSFCKCVIIGDFNFPDIDWSVLMGTSNCFCNFVFDCNLTQHVSEPTHVKGNLLDLVLSSASVVVNRLTVYPLSLVDFSDHHAISFDFCCSVSSVPKCKPGYVYDFRNTDYESISSFLLDSDFSAVFDPNLYKLNQNLNLS